jgi:hypothetical protein
MDPAKIGPDTWISVMSALVVIGAAIKGTMVLVNIQRDLRGIVRKADFKLWAARLQIQNRDLNVPELDEEGDEDAG